MDQIIVPRISIISTEASKLFLSPNCSGVKAKLNKRFRINGKATQKVICFCQAMINTFPKEMVIRIYNRDQAGPKTQEGGAHDGLRSCAYQLYAFIVYFKN